MLDGIGGCSSKLRSIVALTMVRIFWFLLFLSLATLIPVALFLPETSRKLVDNGSIPPPRLCDNITDHIRLRNRKRQGIAVDEHKRLELLRNHRLSFPNPVGTLIVLADGESSILLLVLSLGEPFRRHAHASQG